MQQEEFNRLEEKGIGLPFAVSKTGATVVSQKGESLRPKLSQVGTVIFETIDAVGRVKIDTIEIVGGNRCIVIKVDRDRLTGSLYEAASGLPAGRVYEMLETLDQVEKPPAVAKPEIEKAEVGEAIKPVIKRPAPEEAPKPVAAPAARAVMTAGFLDEIKNFLKEYVGDFADRIYQNQIKAQRIKVDDFSEDDARRLIFALGKAAGMIIGPSKGKELTNKLLAKLK